MEEQDAGLVIPVGLTEKEYLAQLRRIEAATARNSRKMTRDFARANKSASAFGGNGLRMVSLQLSQVGQQGAVTGDYLRALSIQMPDILLAFGTFGALAGAAAAALTPLIANMITSEEKVVTLEERLKDLGSALNEYQRYTEAANLSTLELARKYGVVSDAARAFAFELRNIAAADAVGALDDALQTVIGNVDLVTSDLVAGISNFDALIGTVERLRTMAEKEVDSRLAAALEEQAQALSDVAAQAEDFAASLGVLPDEAFRVAQALQEWQAAANLDDQINEANDLRLVLIDIFGEYEKQPPVIQAIFRDLALTAEQMATFKSITLEAAGAVGEVADQAGRLRRIMEQVEQDKEVVFDPRDPRFDQRKADFARATEQFKREQEEAERALRRSRSSGGSSSSSGSNDLSRLRAEAKSLFEGTRTAAENYSAELERIQTLYDSGLISEETKNRALRDLQDGFTGAAAGAQAFENSVESAFVNFVTGAESAREAISNLLGDLAQLAAQSAFRNLLGSMGGAGAAIGSIFGVKSYDGGGYTGSGPRSGGIDGRGGFPAVLHPNETVIDHTKGGGMGAQISISIDARGAVAGVGAEIDAALARRLPDIQRAAVASVQNARRRGVAV